MLKGYVTLNNPTANFNRVQFSGHYNGSSEAQIIGYLDELCKANGFTDYEIHIDTVPTADDLYEEALCKRLDC